LYIEIDNGSVCQDQVMQQRLPPKAHQETTARAKGQIVFPVRAGPSVDVSRFDRNTEVDVAVCVAVAGSKAATNPDSLNAAILRTLPGHIADQIGMRTLF
jgi:hypothetical protein